MRKIAVFWWIFWLLYSFEVVGPALVEAGWNQWQKQESRTTYCRDGECTTTTHKHKYRDNRQNNFSNFGDGGYYYAPTPSGGGIAPQINMPIDFRPLARALECVVTFLFGGCQFTAQSQRSQPPPPANAPPQFSAEPQSLSELYESDRND